MSISQMESISPFEPPSRWAPSIKALELSGLHLSKELKLSVSQRNPTAVWRDVSPGHNENRCFRR